ncbi:putative e protein [Phialemonium atrogriseum]|uniref:E protein n=1 Tax=Phialemonium atrogriseum TaxID=1093897 RepID=A0AAJ0BRD2_9PEZI|nr:putative e protein [Phialemonium atrogriseum]KAK1763070.1 putative e protein [Phialemonium atrogriseum]
MVYNLMVFAPRKAGVTHEEFKIRYEQHMHLVAEICGDAAPLSHTRWYPQHDGASDKPLLLAGNAEEMYYDAIALMVFEDEAAFGRFCDALLTEEAKARIEADEAGFFDRSRMKVVVIGDVKEWKK